MNFMARICATAVIALAGIVQLPGTGRAADFTRTILTGGPSGTYIQIGRDISAVAGECGLALEVLESAGSLENFLAVRKRPYTQFGIVQSDVLEYMRTYAADDPAIANAVRGVRIAFPLYNEEVHVLATNDIASLSDLSGRRVSVGVADSGTFLTASLVLDLAGVSPAERVNLNAEASLAALKAGQIDAFFYVAGAPTSLFGASGAIDAARFHLLPIDDPTLQAVYAATEIPAGTYPFQSEAIPAIAVKAVLMTYDYSPSRNRYHQESCKAVADISNLILTRFDELRENGHPKWRNVDLNDIPPGWEIGSCVNLGLAADYSVECQPMPSATVVAPSIESEANKAYRSRICASLGC